MKVYKLYLILPDNKYKDLKNCIDTTIPSRYDEDRDIWIILYGFTRKKKLFNAFMEFHSNDFEKKVVDMTEEEYDVLWRECKMARIELYDIAYSFNEKIKIPMTFMEHLYSIDYKEENWYDDFISLASIDYKMFKMNYQELLNEIGYVEAYISFYGTNDEREFWDYNMSYSARPTAINELVMYIMIYSSLLKVSKIQEYVMKKVMKK